MKTTADLQLTTFYVGQDLFGIDVMKVQEVTGTPVIVPIPLAPDYIKGLINLRGQIATAIGMNELMDSKAQTDSSMTVVCKVEGSLVSLIVDSIGDVVEVNTQNYEALPDTLPINIKKYISGVYKLNNQFLSLIDLESILKDIAEK